MKCDRCGKEHPNSVNFREVVGNIMVPGGSDSFIGFNLVVEPDTFSETDRIKVEKCMVERKIPVLSLAGGKVRIYSSIFCLGCFAKICGLKESE